jgi:hypothetical protein
LVALVVAAGAFFETAKIADSAAGGTAEEAHVRMAKTLLTKGRPNGTTPEVNLMPMLSAKVSLRYKASPGETKPRSASLPQTGRNNRRNLAKKANKRKNVGDVASP